MNPLAIFRDGGDGRSKRKQEMKARLLKNREPVLEIMSDSLDIAKACPILLGEKCIGPLCNFFSEYKMVEDGGGERAFWRCDVKEIPLLLIELNRNIRELSGLMKGGGGGTSG